MTIERRCFNNRKINVTQKNVSRGKPLPLLAIIAILVFSTVGCSEKTKETETTNPVVVETTQAVIEETTAEVIEETTTAFVETEAMERFAAKDSDELFKVLEAHSKLSEFDIIVFDELKQEGGTLEAGDKYRNDSHTRLFIHSIANNNDLGYSSETKIVEDKEYLNDNYVEIIFADIEGEHFINFKIRNTDFQKYIIVINEKSDNQETKAEEGNVANENFNYDEWFGSEDYFKNMKADTPALILLNEEGAKVLENNTKVKVSELKELILYTELTRFEYVSSSNEEIITKYKYANFRKMDMVLDVNTSNITEETKIVIKVRDVRTSVEHELSVIIIP